MPGEPAICEVGGGGLLLPLGGDAEQRWPNALRIVLYMLGLGWCFMGVATISDVFMGAIECITSKKVRKQNPKTKRYMTVLVWNPTVANLTLMALGSSAPEILLSVIELFGNKFYSGELGPSTIVGSAAFNLLCIVAVCVSAIPAGDTRKIKEMPVYVVTAFFSVFAYLWMLVILLLNSPHVVEIWEGVFTFMMFPLLVILAFLADKGYFTNTHRKPKPGRAICAEDKEELAALETSIRQDYGENLTEEQVRKFIEVQLMGVTSRAKYRVAATRRMNGGRRVKTATHHGRRPGGLARGMTAALGMARGKPSGSLLTKVVPAEGGEGEEGEGLPRTEDTTIEFHVMKCAVLENAGFVNLTVVRKGNEGRAASVGYRTREGTAKPGSDYGHVESTLTFAEGETKQIITVSIVDDLAYEEDEEFFVDLFDPTVEDETGQAVLGTNQSVTVVIIDDDLPGILAFPNDVETISEDNTCSFIVRRKQGSTGKVTCQYRTEDHTAIAGLDYEPLEGTLEFDNGETEARIDCVIKARGRYEASESFRLILTEATGGAKFDPDTDGGPDSCILTVFIGSEQVAKDRIDRLVISLQTIKDRAKVGHSNWREQFSAALFVNGGGEDDEESEPPALVDYVLHIITVPWKFLFAFCPPTDFCGGWVCFCCSLIMIGGVTAIIGDMASLLGCVMAIPDEVTAITFVALGTSLPDTFASKSAATQDPFADASIGNVTGSNSVNVFLGLGLPWMIGAIYWEAQGADSEWEGRYLGDGDIPAAFKTGAFVVKAGNLAFSVIVFSCCAVACICVLFLRRRLFDGELGGPTPWKYLTSAFLVGLWFLYIGLSSWYTMRE